MDCYFLGKLVKDINGGAHKVLSSALGDHLACWVALDTSVEVGENHLKVLRYMFALDGECPVSRLLKVKAMVAHFCQRYSHTDVTLFFHFGHDQPALPEIDGLLLLLRFHLLDYQESHLWNRVRVLAATDDPASQLSLFPSWLALENRIQQSQVADEVLNFCQLYMSSDFQKLDQVRDFEAAFWRVVNLACSWLEVEDYKTVLSLMPVRFQGPLTDLPNQWHCLRQQELSFSQEIFVRCSRSSFRFCQQLMELRR